MAVTNSAGCIGYSAGYVVFVLKAPASVVSPAVTTCTVAGTTLAVPGLQKGPSYSYTWIKTLTATAITGTSVGTAATYVLPVLPVSINYYRVQINYASGAICSSVLSPAFTINVTQGTTCSRNGGDVVKTEPLVDTAVESNFQVKAYPNPYTDTFKLSLTTSSEDKLEVLVYDMLGKLLDQRESSPSDITEQQMGDRYPSGVYNIIFIQGATMKRLTVIKR